MGSKGQEKASSSDLLEQKQRLEDKEDRDRGQKSRQKWPSVPTLDGSQAMFKL